MKSSTCNVCDYPGCGTELKPLFSSLYCPNEENHGKRKSAFVTITPEMIKASQQVHGIPAFVPACTHPVTLTFQGVTSCRICGEELTTPYP